jgi:hypothetical protein
MSEKRLQQFLQNLRDFDMLHNAEIPFQVVANCPTMSGAEIEAIFASIKPPMPYGGKLSFDGKWTPSPDQIRSRRDV